MSSWCDSGVYGQWLNTVLNPSALIQKEASKVTAHFMHLWASVFFTCCFLFWGLGPAAIRSYVHLQIMNWLNMMPEIG